jgi:hypothetical protein
VSGWAAPAGNIISSVRDMGLLMSDIFNFDRLPKLLAPSTMRDWIRPASVPMDREGGTCNFAGWELMQVRGWDGRGTPHALRKNA